jgi:hypothetical protein
MSTAALSGGGVNGSLPERVAAGVATVGEARTLFQGGGSELEKPSSDSVAPGHAALWAGTLEQKTGADRR